MFLVKFTKMNQLFSLELKENSNEIKIENLSQKKYLAQ